MSGGIGPRPRSRVGSPATGSFGGAFAGTGAYPWLVLALVFTAAAAGGVVWAGGTVAGVVTGHGWHPPAFGSVFYTELFRGRAAAQWPGVPPTAVWAASGALGLMLAGLGVTGWLRLVLRRPAPGDPMPSLATPGELARLAPVGVAAAARQLRPSLTQIPVKRLPAAACGLPLGTLTGTRTMMRASWEDVLLAIMAPRAGKTTALAVPAVLDAPGPVLATSNKADLWSVTSAPRAAVGRVWVFDPQRITYTPHAFWWNPLSSVTGVEDAHRLAQHFLAAKAEEDFWDKAAQELLTGLLLAAAVTDGGTLAHVYRWLTDPAARAPVQALDRAGQPAAAASLAGMQAGAPDTREGIYQTARTAAQALRDPTIMAWVTPPAPADDDHSDGQGDGRGGEERLPAFDPPAFVAGSDTLYLQSKDGAGSAAPLVAALTDAVFRAATRAAERAGGRLDPPLVAVLDEAANICRIKDLPDLYSHLGSRGIVPVTILQSYKQGIRVWGEHGMDALWSAATVKLIGAGIDDARTADDLSRLVGDHDVPVRSVSRHRDGLTESVSLRRQRILAPDEIRALPKGSALLLATGTRAALLALHPWYTGPRADELTTARQQAHATLRGNAEAVA